jgi:catechol 2,3-dioxygenase-like lactoylglutathione lyase family enzyme
MHLSLQASLLNVRNLDRSIAFYRDVLDLHPVASGDRVTALMIDGTTRLQVLLLREVQGANAVHMGRGSIGPRLLGLEAGSTAELDEIEQRLTERNAFIGRRKTETWEAIVGVDPDRIEITVSSSLTGAPIQSQDWTHLDQMIYEVGE